MFTAAQLTQEIEESIARFNQQQVRALHPEWITQDVLNQHKQIAGADVEFWHHVGRAEVADQVRKRLNKYKAKAEIEPDVQLVFDGFERVQERYSILEDGEHVAVRVQDMTFAQRRAKSAELRQMGAGCYQHADELDRYDDEHGEPCVA